jgi:hypothetical protein
MLSRSSVPAVFRLLVALAAPGCGLAQGVVLSLSAGSGSPGSTVVLNLSVNTTGGNPASIEWATNYSTTDFSSVSVSAGAAATAAGKSISCNNTAGSRKCVAWGVNSNVIANGIIATVAMTISGSTKNTSSAVSLSGGLSALPSSTSVVTSTTGAAVTIIQPQGFTITGAVTPSGSGSGTTIALSGAASGTATTDASGNYTLAGLANGAYTVTPSKSGITFSPTSRAVTISGANVTAVNFTATAVTFSVSGTISPAASGSGATVTLSGAGSASATADASGNYSFTGLANGTYTVTSSKSGFTFTPPSRLVTISGANATAINFTASASGTTSALSVNYNNLNFAWSGTLITSTQTVAADISPAASVAWTAVSSQPNITVNPPSGVGSAALQISVNPGPSGMVTVTAAGATNSPQQIQVNIANVTPGLPSGSFDTPIDNTTGIAGAIAVTGWALDNLEVASVGIWREPFKGEPTGSNGLAWIGNATLVPGARSDIQVTFPSSPWNYRGGWGYMLLTNFLPNPGGPMGNGNYRLHAIAVNKAGNSLDLGTRTITVDNVHASKPFGTIDTPDQGGTASGSAFVNFGWALTQNPYLIPLDGSTITVIVDGVTLGHPTYNQYRSDIANLFPGLANSNGAVGFFYLDTTKLANGLHTISWVVSDNGGRTDGIGSRYFGVLNSGLGGMASPAESEPVAPMERALSAPRLNHQLAPLVVDHDGAVKIDVDELGHIELPLGATSGYVLVNGERTALPIGSTLQNGVFYWQLGPGFLGDYPMLFERPDGTDMRVKVSVRPGRHGPLESIQ